MREKKLDSSREELCEMVKRFLYDHYKRTAESNVCGIILFICVYVCVCFWMDGVMLLLDFLLRIHIEKGNGTMRIHRDKKAKKVRTRNVLLSGECSLCTLASKYE